MAVPAFDQAKHPRGFHGRFGHGTGPGGAAAIFGMGASKARLQLAVKKPMAPLPPEMRSVAGAGPARAPAKASRAVKRTARDVMSSAKTPQEHIEALRAFNEPGAAQYAAGLKGRQLDDVLRHAGVARTGTVAQKRSRLVGHTRTAPAAPPVGAAAPPKTAPARAESKARALLAGGPAATKMAGRTGLAHSPQEAATRMRAMGSRGEAEQYLAKATKADLMAVADKAGVSYRKSATKPQLQTSLIHHTVGARADHNAIMGVNLRPAGGHQGPRMSTEALAPNTWGGAHRPGDVHFHADGEIGQAISRMGGDAHLEVDGHALGNVLGHIATDTVMGRATAQQQVQRLKQVRDQLPEGSAARRQLDDAIEELDAPHTSVPALPEGTPAPLRQLMADLHQVPLVRRDPSREQAPLTRIAGDFAAGRTGGLRLIEDVRRLHNQRHESTEGKFDIDRAVAKAVTALEALRRADRSALSPPTQR